jgi:predicted phage terminase large subunit-like protein
MARLLTPQQIASLTPAERATIHRETEREQRAAETLLEFIPRVSPGHVSPVHLRILAECLDRARNGERLNVCVSVPPGHGKTELLLHAAVQRLSIYPQHTIGYVTYGSDLSVPKSRLARDYALAAGVRLRSDSTAVQEWMTAEGGAFKASSIGGSLTGRHLDELFFDDPFKNRDSAESPRERERVYNFFTSTATTRCKANASRFVVHTRWHEDDLIGRLAATGKWTVINLPAVADDGSILLPETKLASGSVFGYSRELLAERRAENEYDWWSLYQGNPRPKGGSVFKREPLRFTGDGREGRRIVLSLDGAGTESTRADYTVCLALAVSGRGKEMTCNVVDMLRVQLEPQDSARLLRTFIDRNGGGLVHIEATRDGKAIAKALKQIDNTFRFEEVVPIGDKFTRAQPVASAWNGVDIEDEKLPQRVALPVDAVAHPWVKDFLGEVRLFTGAGDKHDDCVDAMSQGWNVAARPTASMDDLPSFPKIRPRF